ncbi:hypothetical protein ACPCG0_13340 [Propionibacteriaceae bacterium Y1923]|uniref:hypothetical protein n=1 Tax=Aestuariimicrobium sp. Y1814 TaxID=3418742 RepID=UPI003C15BD68
MEHVIDLGSRTLALQSSSSIASVGKLVEYTLAQVAGAADQWTDGFLVEAGSWIFRLDERAAGRWQLQALSGGPEQWSDDATEALELMDSQYRVLARVGVEPAEGRVDHLVLVHEDVLLVEDPDPAALEFRRRSSGEDLADDGHDSGWYLGPVGADVPRPDQLVRRTMGSLAEDFPVAVSAMLLPLGTVVRFDDNGISSVVSASGTEHWKRNRAV